MNWLKISNNTGEHRGGLAAIAATAVFCFPYAVTADDVKLQETSETVSMRVEHELTQDPGVNTKNVSVNVNEGVVTLDGKVPTLLSKDRAAKIGETVRGVRSVVNLLKVVPTKGTSDKAVQQNVEAAWLSDPATDSYEIQANVTDGAATISGQVESYQEKQLSEEVARSVNGVTDVQNNIQVMYESERPDREIRAEIQQAHHYNAYIDRTSRILVDVNDGKVTLRGACGSAAEKARIVDNAWVGGVTSVDAAKLQTNGYLKDDDRRKQKFPKVTDDAIIEAVNDALLYDPRVNMFDVDVTSDLRRVTLRGEVDNLKAKRSAVQDARNTFGVWHVYDRIQVIPATEIADRITQQNVEAAIRRNGFLDESMIDVAVNNGSVRLTGTVTNFFEMAQADDVASTITGVTYVSNDLSVTDHDIGLQYRPSIDPVYPNDLDWYDYEPTPVVKSDAKILKSINDEMWWSPFVDSEQVMVSVDDGQATLRGKVDSWYEREQAVENALEGGAWKVVNKLEYVK